ncbi:hypothetical protein ACT29H_11780 [Thermophagus sp. OGC60D27]|uniref:hypothetical protein n=1 Tax=Thermophagus sp. OGC60D27 TaxID=3458415 RepID=UPI0040376F52
MRSTFLFLSIIFLCGCSQSKSDQIQLFNGISFQLQQKEIIRDITPSTIEFYDSLFNGPFSEIPLYRNIQHPQYSLFIGMPFNTSLQKIMDYSYAWADSSIIMKQANDSSFLITYKVENAIAMKYAIQTGNSNLFFLSGLTQEKVVADSLFTLKKLSKRFIHN